MQVVSSYTPTPFELRSPTSPDKPIEPKLSMADIIAIAQADGARRGWDTPVGSVFYAQTYGIYGALFFKPGDDHGAGGVGPPRLYYDGIEAVRSAKGCHGQGLLRISSYRRSFRCIRGASSDCLAVS